MTRNQPFLYAVAVLLATWVIGLSVSGAPTLKVPAGINHSPWDALLKKYVDERGRVDYAAWNQSEDDLGKLDRYVAEFSVSDGEPAAGEAEIASLINAYNAFTIRWMLENFPVRSIRETKDAWPGERWNVGGREISLDEIEHENLRKLYRWKVHATIVCAARSCPPLQRSAFSAENLSELTDRAFRAWLGREDLNKYQPEENRVLVSRIFEWFSDDFSGDGELAKVLETYGPRDHLTFFIGGGFEVDYLDYNWGLNDQGELGEDYKPGVGTLLKNLF